MSYTDSNKIIRKVWIEHLALAYVAMVPGDLVARDTSNDGYKLADQTDTAADAVCLDNLAAGATGRFAKAAICDSIPSESAGVWSATAFTAATTENMDLLYLGDDGKPQSSAGTVAQPVGYVLNRYQILLQPQQWLSSTSMTLSGNAIVGGTLAVTGATTLTGATTQTGALAINGGATVATGKNFTMVKGTLTNTEGNVVLTKGDLTLTAGDATLTLGDLTLTAGALTLTLGDLTLTAGNIIMTAGDIRSYVLDVSTTPKTLTIGGTVVVDTSASDIELTLPTATIGTVVTLMTTSATKQLNIIASASDKILDTSHAAKASVKGNAAAGNMIVLQAVSVVNWATISSRGTWTYS